MITNIFLVTFVIVYIVDYSGIIFDLSKFIYKQTHKGKEWKYQIIGKPFGCSVCMSFWINTLLILCYGQSLVLALTIGCLSSLGTNIYKLIINYYNKITNK